MTYLIAAAGTGGHVFPGLAVGEALVDLGVDRDSVLFVGGDRMEASVYPDAGFPFLQLELRGLKRSLSPRNLGLPRMVWRARDAIGGAIRGRGVKVALGMGGYVTLPAAMAARRAGTTLFIAEQNAGAGLANRIASRWASHAFVSFPETDGLPSGEWVGNPVRRPMADFDREALRLEAGARYGIDPGKPVLGVLGGSLGAGILNRAAVEIATSWSGPPLCLVHLTGRGNLADDGHEADGVGWHQVEFEDRMELFYAICDLVIARAGGGVAELTATGTPSILVPGEFGSSGHQKANAEFLRGAGAAILVPEEQIDDIASVVARTLFDPDALKAMRRGAEGIAKPDAAARIASTMVEVAR
jgi:UDP-N-acetylglucosamine--N-acetylmuramyl-(pentapeptide) pyrophosphoryl-undecaprenol N-acetylglucosamine transferase